MASDNSDFVLINLEQEKKRAGGRPRGDYWEYFERTEVTTDGHAKATCKFCGDSWYRGEKSILMGHLANHCKMAPSNIVQEYLTKMSETVLSGVNSSKKQRSNDANSTGVTGQTLLTQAFNKIEKLNLARVNRLN